MSHHFGRIGSALTAALSLAFAARAGPMIYTYQVNAGGQLNDQTVTNTDGWRRSRPTSRGTRR